MLSQIVGVKHFLSPTSLLKSPTVLVQNRVIKMLRAVRRVLIGSVALVGCSVALSAGQGVIRIVVPFPAGGVTDQTARIVAERISQQLGRIVIVENRPGAGTRLGTDAVFKAAANGETLLFTNSSYSILSVIDPKVPWSLAKPLVPIAITATYGLQIVTGRHVPANTLAEFIAFAKQRPGRLSYGSSGLGSGSHFAGEFFKALSGTFIVHIPYKSTPDAVRDVAGGVLDLAFDATAKPLIDGGHVKLLAVTSDKRDPRFPNTPTAAEAGLKPFVLLSWVGLLGPPGLSDALVNQLNKAVDLTNASGDVRKRIEESGLRVQGGSPRKLALMIKDELSLYSNIAATSRLKFD